MYDLIHQLDYLPKNKVFINEQEEKSFHYRFIIHVFVMKLVLENPRSDLPKVRGLLNHFIMNLYHFHYHVSIVSLTLKQVSHKNLCWIISRASVAFISCTKIMIQESSSDVLEKSSSRSTT